MNGVPIDLVEPAPLRLKALEPLKLLGEVKTGRLDIRVRVRGGGGPSQIYAIRQVWSVFEARQSAEASSLTTKNMWTRLRRGR